MPARPLWRVSLAAGRRSARSRRQAAMRSPGRSRAPISIRSGPPTATATIISNIGHLSGTSAALESLETSFHQDLNGDGVIGIYAAPSTSLQISSALSGIVRIGNDWDRRYARTRCGRLLVGYVQ